MRNFRFALKGMNLFLFAVLLFIIAGADPLVAQAPPGPSNQAAALVAQSLAALTHGTAVVDAKLQADVIYVAGSDEEAGPATLEASGHLTSRVTMNLNGGQRLQIQNGTQLSSTGLDGQLHDQAMHNSLNWSAWFFPALALEGLVRDPSYSASYLGPDNYAGSLVQHLRAVRHVPGQADTATTALLLELTTVDFYLDASSMLPTALEYNIHPDGNALQNIPVSVEFGNYQSVSGVQTPFHIRQLLQGSPFLDISVTSGTINSGLPPADFEIQ